MTMWHWLFLISSSFSFNFIVQKPPTNVKYYLNSFKSNLLPFRPLFFKKKRLWLIFKYLFSSTNLKCWHSNFDTKYSWKLTTKTIIENQIKWHIDILVLTKIIRYTAINRCERTTKKNCSFYKLVWNEITHGEDIHKTKN